MMEKTELEHLEYIKISSFPAMFFENEYVFCDIKDINWNCYGKDGSGKWLDFNWNTI